MTPQAMPVVTLAEVATRELCQIIREPAVAWFNPREFAALMELLRRLKICEAKLGPYVEAEYAPAPVAWSTKVAHAEGEPE